nr:MAG: replication associated protein [Cressdnaviricota sp.]
MLPKFVDREESNRRSNAFALTIWELTPESIPIIYELGPLVRYLIIGLETCPDTGKAHYQGYINWGDTLKSYKQMHELFPHPDPTKSNWIRAARRGHKANEIYCKKDGNIMIELGEPMVNPGQREKLDWAAVVKSAKAGKYDEIPESIFMRCYSTINRMTADYKATPPDNTYLNNYWIHGKTGKGKSSYLRPLFRDVGIYVKNITKDTFDGYKGEECLYLEDFGPEHVASHRTKLLQYADHYAFRVDVKFSHNNIRPTFVLVTSNFSLEDLYPGDAALARRFKVMSIEEFKELTKK